MVEYLVVVGAIALAALGGFGAFGRDVGGVAEREAACVRTLSCGGSSSFPDAASASASAARDGDESGGDDDVPPPPPPPPPPQGLGATVGDFFRGMVLGDYAEGGSEGARTAGQVVGGFVPILGQAADLRDFSAAAGDVWNGREGGWGNVGLATIAFVPGFGDAIKGGARTADAAAIAAARLSRAAELEREIARLKPGERVAMVRSHARGVAEAKGWSRMPKISKTNGRDVYRDAEGNYWAVDTQHGRLEKLDRRGKHQGEFDMDGKLTKPADRSGKHDLEIP